jgi:hypothetical protein
MRLWHRQYPTHLRYLMITRQISRFQEAGRPHHVGFRNYKVRDERYVL